MLSIDQCERRLATLDAAANALTSERLARLDAVEVWYQKRKRTISDEQQQVRAELDRLRAKRAQTRGPGGPFVVRKMGQFLMQSGHWQTDPDDITKMERYAYRAVAERTALLYDGAEVRSWPEFQQELESRRHAADDIGPEPPMPGDDATLADYNKWEKDHKAWEQKKFAAAVK